MSKSGTTYRLRFRDHQLHMIPANLIKESPHNWRLHLEPQRLALEQSFREIGVVAPAIVRELKGGFYELIDGHLRKDMIGSHQEVPCLITDLTADESRKQITVHDPISAMAGQDTEKLSLNLKFLTKKGDDALSKLVFPDYIIDPLLSANWKPDKPGEMPGRGDDTMGGHVKGVEPIELTRKERSAIKKAIEKWISENPDDEEETEGAIVAKICRYFTS